MSDDSDIQNKTGKRRKRPLNPASSPENSDSGSPLATSKRSRKQFVCASDSEDTDSEIDSEFLKRLRPKKKVAQAVESEADVISSISSESSPVSRPPQQKKVPIAASDDEPSSSEDEGTITNRPILRRGPPKILSDCETGDSNDDDGVLTDSSSGSSSENEDGPNDKESPEKAKLNWVASNSGSDSDGQSERCPICLARFSSQEIGSPESCDHCFCALCIQEWAKNVNTCPVDRQPFSLILVRLHLEGKIIRQIPVNPRTENQEVPEDATFCEVCGLSDREDRMLLCDSCDHGYHMECLNPPLDYVPIDEWYCPDCNPPQAMARRRASRTQRQVREESVEEVQPSRHRPAPRLLPRTLQSERVHTSLRNLNVTDAPTRRRARVPPSTSSGVELVEGESSQVHPQQQTRRIQTTANKTKRRRKRKRQSKYRIKRIVTDDGVIEVRVGRKKKRKYQKRRKNCNPTPRTVKGRLAHRLGMCAPRMTRQTIPETLNRQELINAPINHQRHQAGVPTLDIFGRRDQLDYFSESDEEDEGGSVEGGVGVLSRARVARPSDRLISRKKAASVLSSTSLRKPLKVDKIAPPASGSLLDSILDSQALWHSKKTEIKSSSDGSIHVIFPQKSKDTVLKEENKVDIKTATTPVVQTPMFPGGRVNSEPYKPDNSSRGGNNRGGNMSNSERQYEESNFQTSGSGGAGFSSYESSVGSSPLRGMAPIRFRMNAPPRRPNIHSYPSDNIPPPPPLRMRAPILETSFPTTNSPETSPAREEEEIDIYSDIEQENTNETEEKTFGAMEPPPEPPFLMTMEPPPEPPAILMNINDDASDDEPSGLVIDDPPQGDVYDPCAINSDDSSTGDTPLARPPEIPLALKDPELVADYSSESSGPAPSYNPELPTYLSTPIIGPLPRPVSHNSSEADDDDEECPNFSMYSAESMNLAHRGHSAPIVDLDIPIPPSIESNINIPLPDNDSPDLTDNEENIDVPVVQDALNHDDDKMSEDVKSLCEDTRNSVKSVEESNTEVNNLTAAEVEELDGKSIVDGDVLEEGEDGDDEDEDEDDSESDDESEDENSTQEDTEKVGQCKVSKIKGSSEAAEDECSTQGDVLDLAIESEANLENNIPHDDKEEQHEINLAKSPVELDEISEKIADGGDKSDGLVDITDEEMSEYDGQDNGNDLEKLGDQALESSQNDKNDSKSLDSDDNSLIGGATSAVSGGTLNNSDNVNSDNVQPPILPGLEGLETETISESEDVNFDELPLEEGTEQPEFLPNEEDHNSSKKKKKKKYRKVSHTEDNTGKGSSEPIEFEEGEIIEDKPKTVSKKDKKTKPKQDCAVEVDENVEVSKSKTPAVEKETVEKKPKKKKDKMSTARDKNDKAKEFKEKTLKPGQMEDNVSWKKISKSNKERNYRDGKEKEERDKDRENKDDSMMTRKEKRNKERRKELERYDVRRLISEKPKRPKKDEFGRDISPSKSGSSLSPYRPRYKSPLRTRNRSRTRSRSWKSRSRSRGRKRRSRSRENARSRERPRRVRSRDRSKRRSRSRNKVPSRSRERKKTPVKDDKNKTGHRSVSRTRRKSRSPSAHSRRHRSLSYSRSWTLSWSRSSMSRSRSPRGRRKSRSLSRSRSRSWTKDQNAPTLRGNRAKDPPKNLTVIVTNKEAMKKKEKKKPSKKKDDRRKKKRGQSPAPSKEVFTSGDNILVSVNFKNANKNPELIPASTPLLRESTKRKRDDVDGSAKKKKTNNSSKKTPGAKKSNRLAKINEVTRNAKPVAIIDLDLSPFREQTPSPKEVIILSDSGDEEDKQHSERQDNMDRMGHNSMNQSMLSLSSIDHGQKDSISQPESPLSSNFMLNSSGPKTPPEPHIKFSISTKPSQIRMLSNPLMEPEDEMQDENIENDENEILHKGPNTPPEPPPDLNTPASPPTTPYDPFDPTKSRSPSPQPRNNDTNSLQNTSREDKLDNMQNDDNDHPHLTELRTTPLNESEDLKKTPESAKVHSTPKSDPNITDVSPKVSPPAGTLESIKLTEDTLMKPIQKLLASANKLDVTVHKSPEKLITVVISQQVKNINQTPKQAIQSLKAITPNKHQTPKGNSKHQLFSSSLVKQVPILGTLPLLPGPPVYTPSMGLNISKTASRVQQNGDPSDDMDIDPSSPYSPGSSEGDDLFEPPIATPPKNSTKSLNKSKSSSGNKFDSLFGSSPAKPRHGRHSSKPAKKTTKPKSKGSKKEEVKVKLDEDQLKILDDLPSSAVEMQVKDKFLKKLNRQERVVEEVKLVLKPHYAKKHVNKDEYKEILRRAVPKICHNKSGEINPIKIQFLIEAYVKKFRYAKKKASGTLTAPAQNKPKPQKALWS